MHVVICNIVKISKRMCNYLYLKHFLEMYSVYLSEVTPILLTAQ